MPGPHHSIPPSSIGDHKTYCQTAFGLSFSEHIRYTQNFISAIRQQAQLPYDEETIRLNAPFELRPQNYDGQRAVLLIHGFLTSSYVMRALGAFYQSQGFLVRALLLPGHGSAPTEINAVSAHDWLNAARYGVQSLQQEAKEVHLAGFSLGATLCSLMSYEYPIASLALFAPAHGISRMAVLLPLLHGLSQYKGLSKLAWLWQAPQRDPFTYQAYTAYGANEVRKTIAKLHAACSQSTSSPPCFMAATLEDGTVNALSSVKHFMKQHHAHSHMLLYSAKAIRFKDPRIEVIHSASLGHNIHALSHVALPIAPEDLYYGRNGTHYGPEPKDIILGEINAATRRNKRFRRLSYHPGFAKMLLRLSQFYLQLS